ncbi:hypothetical protein A1Q1_04202 [Trichosporon asahii var. asahii CBS 2479]|uniref:Uncharacterized protein n=1 Tax=Trichosporon asahii var. asahii (strain ATCC 90039 / CBS 2479 / JCM 2466 / KCTC 7840 / NBRC 103889/ NCYC 2677 / UAMH 7654) TaxID=1186058 RepID=J6ER30_TRIAS|nr:hypothetical protein A1Q1_04202 [Trichosporon asahii var. asahii CBS 2479]EJT46959.1 hypothetical protein A1Q1_04202 [Trichosporon asahii var. asahii CBS 2479]
MPNPVSLNLSSQKLGCWDGPSTGRLFDIASILHDELVAVQHVAVLIPRVGLSCSQIKRPFATHMFTCPQQLCFATNPTGARAPTVPMKLQHCLSLFARRAQTSTTIPFQPLVTTALLVTCTTRLRDPRPLKF